MKRSSIALCLALAAAACGDNLTHPDRDAYGAGGSAPLSCVPNLDGRIDSSELEESLDVAASYLVSPKGKETEVDLEGVVGGDGKRRWDFSVDRASDQAAALRATSLTGKWYQASFPTGQFAAPVDAAGTLEGVYVRDAEALSLLGVASAEESPAEGQTLLVYDRPIALYRFPVEVGASWTSSGEVVNGVVRGLPYAGSDRYEVADVAVGELALPAFTFTQAHRVDTKVTISPSAGGEPAFTRQVGFLFECFGEVARATSRANEPAETFTTAAELRRLGE
jgi:hypothetical protein